MSSESPNTPTAATRVVLAEDNATMRRSLRMVLETEPDIEVVAEASDLAGALVQVMFAGPRVLVLDLRMPGGSSIELIEHMRAEHPETEIVVVTMLDGPAFARRVREVGAKGFVVKDSADAELADAVRLAARGLDYTSPQVAPGLA